MHLYLFIFYIYNYILLFNYWNSVVILYNILQLIWIWSNVQTPFQLHFVSNFIGI